MTIWRMRIACWITKATNTHSQYAILIDFPLYQWLHERASTLRYADNTSSPVFHYHSINMASHEVAILPVTVNSSQGILQ